MPHFSIFRQTIDTINNRQYQRLKKSSHSLCSLLSAANWNFAFSKKKNNQNYAQLFIFYGKYIKDAALPLNKQNIFNKVDENGSAVDLAMWDGWMGGKIEGGLTLPLLELSHGVLSFFCLWSGKKCVYCLETEEEGKKGEKPYSIIMIWPCWKPAMACLILEKMFRA